MSPPPAREAPRVEAPLAEHVVNARGEVMVLVHPLPSRPVAWRRIQDTASLGLGFRDAAPLYLTLTPSSIESAVAQARVLVVEVERGAPVRDTWVGFAAT